MRPRSFLFSLALVAVAPSALAQASAADRESARAAFTEANQLRDAGKVREALEKYKAAFALVPTPVTALEVGRAQADLGRLVEARETLLGVERMSGAGQESPKSRAARKEAAALSARLAARIPKITIRVIGDADEVTVSVDGSEVPRAALAVARSLDPGRHAVMAVAFGHTLTRTVDLREGEQQNVDLDASSLHGAGGSQAQAQIPWGGAGLGGAQPAGGGGIVAFNQPDDGHAWSLRDPKGKTMCQLPCAQSLGFGFGYTVVRDDGEKVSVPGGLAPLPGTTAQVEPRGSAGSRAVGWGLLGGGAGGMVVGLVVMLAGTGSSDSGPVVAGGLIGGAGALALTVGLYVAALSHGPILLRTDSGMPIRVSLSPAGVSGTF